ncbi:MAG: VWA domain-containing protein [Polyangiaceae bacterium]|nr:VWA domain-containing protein [Polyangiaceae bacterium]
MSLLGPLYVGLVWAGIIPDHYLRLARPWATLLGFISVFYITLRLVRITARQTKVRAYLSDALATFTALAASFAAAGPEIGRPLDRLTILIALDRSRSVDLVPNAEQRITQELGVAELGMKEDDRIGTIVFAADAATEDPPRPKSQLPSPQRVSLGRDGTDLASAMRRALAEVPSDSAARIVLITDGVATRGDTMSAAAAAVAAQIPVDVLPLEQRLVPDVRVVSVRAPARADRGEAFDLRLVTSSPGPADIEVRIKRDGQLIAKAPAHIAAGEDVLRIREIAADPGLHRYDVEITANDPKQDEAPEDNSGAAFMRVRGPSAALILEGDAGKGAFIAKTLENAQFRVDQGTTTDVPTDIGGLAAYDLVVLSDIRASDISPTQIDALASYVRDLGGGLWLMGGDKSMGPGGYARTPLEEVSPVSFDLKQEQRRASLAEVIGIDISGSMAAMAGAHTKLELANEAAARSAALLGPGDMLGVEHVDTAVHWSVPLQAVTDKLAIDKAIRSVGPGGGGIIVPITLEAGYKALEGQKVNLKHMLLLADGSDAEDMGPPTRAMVADALRKGITTSIVAIGNGGDVPELEVLSRLGNGRFYLIEDAQRLPAVFTQETILAARSAVVEKPFTPTRGAPSAVLQNVAIQNAPPLKGYVVTIPKGRATVHLRGIDGDPVLATWSAGVGRSAAFTSDLKDRWGVNWTTWPDAARMVVQVARDIARKEEDVRVRLEADAAGGQLHIGATVVGDDGRAQSFKRLLVHVAGPDGFSREMALEAVGAGSYSASIPLSRPGTYIAVARDELSGEALGTTGAVLTAGEELRPTGTDNALLGRIADLTGGKKRDTLAGIFGDRATKRFSYKDATPTFILLAAIGLLLAVAARKLALPEGLLTAVLKPFKAKPREAPQTGPERNPDAMLGALLDAKNRGQTAPSQQGPSVHNAPSVWQGSPGAPQRPIGPYTTPQAGPRQQAPWQSPQTPHLPSATSPPAQSQGEPPAEGPKSHRPLTAAEILLARRKGKPMG